MLSVEESKKKNNEYCKKYYYKNKEKINKRSYTRIKEKLKNDLKFKQTYDRKKREAVIRYRLRNLEICKLRDRLYHKKRRLRDRFEIFKRDRFTCQYCGRKAPDVMLEIDHIIPKSKNGKDKIENYCTACRECNVGKADIFLTKE